MIAEQDQYASIKLIDGIYTLVDECIHDQDFAAIDRLLLTNTKLLPCDALLSLLTATLPIRNRLGNRPSFARMAEQQLLHLGYKDVDLLMKGLE